MAKHNKKRNTGLLYEFLARYIANSIVENDERKRDVAFKIINKHFKPGTELYREFRLFNALISTSVSSDGVAASIVSEAKKAARKYDSERLDKEKSLLIRDINHNLSEGSDFYNQQVTQYKEYATIQQLLNEWRSEDPDLGKIAEYEDKLSTWLLEQKQVTPLQEHVADDSDALVVKIMTKKLNEKYSNIGTTERKLIQDYVFNEQTESLLPRIQEIKTQALEGIDNYIESSSVNKYTKEKLLKVRESIVNERFEVVNDTTIERILDVAKLKEELCQSN